MVIKKTDSITERNRWVLMFYTKNNLIHVHLIFLNLRDPRHHRRLHTFYLYLRRHPIISFEAFYNPLAS